MAVRILVEFMPKTFKIVYVASLLNAKHLKRKRTELGQITKVGYTSAKAQHTVMVVALCVCACVLFHE